ncbi:LysM peptidoglycan-binding domain-containing protein [Streptomyces axinellae]|uniref:Resuscitation-promoting factor protein RpfC n=1 Tax=Streptomyces axinellae TaxID=552788 RepID=A0ABN3Q8J2_9ACTN
MRSGNGRHRRPRQAPAFVVTAGVTGAGIALPLLGATGAHAADAATWDRVAQCASDGIWSAKGSDGHYGGLQLSQEMWDQYGGTSFAERPDLASRSQQIAVAEKILQARGTEAFGDCADSADLDQAQGTPDVDPGSGYPAPAPSEDHASGEDAPGKESLDPDEHDSKPDDSKSGKPDDSSSDGSKSNKQNKPNKQNKQNKPDDGPSSKLPSDAAEGPVTPENPDETANPSDSAKPSAPGKGKHRGSPEDDHASRGDHPSDSDRASRDDDRAHRTPAKHRVQPGDSLSQIAADEDVRGGWPELYERNKDEVGPDPDLIHPGQTLRL